MKIATRRQLLADDSPITYEGRRRHDATTLRMNERANKGNPVAASLAALLLLAIGSGSAIAQAPINDLFDFAIPAIVGNDYGTLDTTQATTDADDFQLNQTCGYPATDASVWYKYEGNSDIGVIVDVSQSSYSANIIVGTGTPGNLEAVSCGGYFGAIAGNTYYILAIDDPYDEVGYGGDLRIDFSEVQLPALDFTVNRSGRFNSKTGIAIISGSYTCSNADYLITFMNATQKVGRLIIRGLGTLAMDVECDQKPHPWTVELTGDNGKFGGGKLIVDGNSIIYSQFGNESKSVEELTVQLRGGKKK